MRDRNYTSEEIIRRGHEIYDREIHDRLEASHEGQLVVVDVTTGTWEIDEDDVAASDRALARNPDAVLYFAWVGHPAAYRLGVR